MDLHVNTAQNNAFFESVHGIIITEITTPGVRIDPREQKRCHYPHPAESRALKRKG